MNKFSSALFFFFLIALSSLVAVEPATRVGLPYLENFDSVTCPALPPGWSSVVNTTNTYAGVRTYHVGGHSVPQYAQLGNWDDPNAQLFLISPAIDDGIPLSSIRTDLWASGHSNFPNAMFAELSVGVMIDPLNPSTYTEISLQTILPGYHWYSVDLINYSGPGRYIAFKLVPTTTWKTLFLDDIRFRTASTNDLHVVSLSGSNYFVCSEEVTHTVSLRNVCRQAQSDYSLNLMHRTGIIATVAGQLIPPGEELSMPFTWTDDTPGTDTLWVELVSTGDDTPDNNRSANFKIVTEPAGTDIHTVGNGDIQAPLPIRIDWKNNLTEMIYHADEFDFSGQITSLVFFSNFIADGLFSPVSIWMGGTLEDDMSFGWTPSQHLDLVWEGQLNFNMAFDPVHVTLSQPFIYGGGNLIVYVLKQHYATWILPAQNFFCQSADNYRSRTVYSDTVVFNAEEPPVPSVSQLAHEYPRMSFFLGEEILFSGSLNGFVRNQFGAPLNGVLIRLGNSAYIAQTDADGYYSMSSVYCGDYNPRLSRGQYCQPESPVQILPGTITEQDFVIETTANIDPELTESISKLVSVYPNPFRNKAIITFQAAKDAEIELIIYNTRGQKVRSLKQDMQQAGRNSALWDAHDDSGKLCGSGIYVCRMKAGEKLSTLRMVLMK